jgi:phosphatidylglycerophosphate synthase
VDAVAAWQQRHPGVHAALPVRLWVGAIGVLASPAAFVPATVWTLAGIGCAAAVLVVPRPIGAALLVAGAVCDGLDGAVASYRGTVSRRGAWLDTSADRIADALLLVALVLDGAPAWLAVVAFAAVVVQEGARRSSTVLTPGERPTRVVLGVVGLLWSPTVAVAVMAPVCVLSAMMLLRPARP